MSNNLPVILAIALALRLIGLNQSLWLDEAINLQAVNTYSFLPLVSQYSLGDFHPPLYHLILKLWTGVFGSDEISARLLSVCFSLVNIVVVYYLVRLLKHQLRLKKHLFNVKLEDMVTFLLAVSPLHLYYSQEARMYMLAAALVSLTFYFFLQAKAKPSRKNLILSSLCLILSLYTDYLPWLLLPLWLLILPKVTFISLLALIPWLPFFLKQLQIGTTVAASLPKWGSLVGGLTPKSLLLVPLKFTLGRIAPANFQLYLILAAGIFFLLFTLFLSSLVLSIRKSSVWLWLIWAWLFLPLLLAAFISLFVPIFTYFRFLFVLPAFYFLLILGATKLKPYFQSNLIGLILIITLTSSAIYLAFPHFHRENWRDSVAYLENRAQSHSPVVLFPSLAQAAPYLYYCQKQLPLFDDPSWQALHPDRIFIYRYLQEVFDPTDHLRKSVEQSGYLRTIEKDFNGVVLWEYLKLPEP